MKIHASKLYELNQTIFKNTYIYMYVCMHAISINKKRGHEIEGEWGVGRVYGRVWREEKKGRNVIIV